MNLQHGLFTKFNGNTSLVELGAVKKLIMKYLLE